MQNKTKPKNNQDYFNRVWQHFVIEGNTKCSSPTGQCYYRHRMPHEKTQACIVGCVLPDKLAKVSDSYDDTSIEHVIGLNDDVKDWLKNVDVNLLVAAQQVHDNSFTDEYNYELCTLAKNWGLKVPKT